MSKLRRTVVTVVTFSVSFFVALEEIMEGKVNSHIHVFIIYRSRAVHCIFVHIIHSVISVALPFADSWKLFELKIIAVPTLFLCLALSGVDQQYRSAVVWNVIWFQFICGFRTTCAASITTWVPCLFTRGSITGTFILKPKQRTLKPTLCLSRD